MTGEFWIKYKQLQKDFFFHPLNSVAKVRNTGLFLIQFESNRTKII